jgi:hypothetical protein
MPMKKVIACRDKVHIMNPKTFRKFKKVAKRKLKEPSKEYNFSVFENQGGGTLEHLMDTAVRPDKDQTEEISKLMAGKGSDAVMDYFKAIVIKANPKLKGKDIKMIKTD